MTDTAQLTSPREVRTLLETLGHRPKKGLGQNYLIDGNVLDIITNTADIQPNESVLEIGPGLGVFTERIIPKAKSVTCIEKDQAMVKYLQSRFKGLDIIESDVLDVDLESMFANGITKVAAVLPYSVASRLMVDMAECRHRPECIVLTIQKEVADRLTASAGGRAYGLLSVLTSVFYRSERVKTISPTCFLPSPKVWSALVRMKRRPAALVGADIHPLFKRLVKHCFSRRRKQLGTSLKSMGVASVKEVLCKAEIEQTERPETLEIDRWAVLAQLLA